MTEDEISEDLNHADWNIRKATIETILNHD